MRESEIAVSRESMLRKRITFLNKAMKGNKTHPNGLSRMNMEYISQELANIQVELLRRKTLQTKVQNTAASRTA